MAASHHSHPVAQRVPTTTTTRLRWRGCQQGQISCHSCEYSNRITAHGDRYPRRSGPAAEDLRQNPFALRPADCRASPQPEVPTVSQSAPQTQHRPRAPAAPRLSRDKPGNTASGRRCSDRNGQLLFALLIVSGARKAAGNGTSPGFRNTYAAAIVAWRHGA